MSIFQTKEYLDLFTRHFVKDISHIALRSFEILPDKRAVLLGMKPVLNEQEVTDYGDISDSSAGNIKQLIQELKSQYGVAQVQFDYIREDSELYKTLTQLSTTPPIQQEVAPFIALPSTWDTYLESLERTDRKELKRKMKRLDTVTHEFQLFEYLEHEDEFEEFIRLHKLSDNTKDMFMTDPMKAFFKELLFVSIPEWNKKLAFLYIEGKPAAAVLYFENESELLLYNSGYDPDQKYYSAGFLLVAHLIKKSIEEKKKTFDFLRGSERYKYDLGGTDIKLFRFLLD